MALIEQWGSREIRLNAEGIAGQRIHVCDWDEIETLCPSIGETWPGKNYLYVQDVRYKGFGVKAEGGYSKCRVVVNYTTRQVTKPVESMDFSGESLEVSAGRSWYTDGTTCPRGVSTLYPEIERSVAFTTPFLNVGLIYDLIGCINMFPFLVAAPQRILFAGCRARTEYTNLNEMAWRVEFRFIYRSCSWQWVWREDTATWDMPVPTLYNAANLGLLMM